MFGDGNEPYISVWPGTGDFNSTTVATNFKSRTKCDGILTSAKLQLLWSDFGSESNPQPGIVAARVKYGKKGEFMTECERPVDCVDMGNRTTRFRIETAIEYYKVEGTRLEMFVPEPPRLVPPLPDDVFYPFGLKNVL